jgi:UDPglucose 6-dehydrogenase
MRLGVFGLGKLGLCSAACFAAKGHRVIGYDINRETMAALQTRRSPVRESGLKDILSLAWPTFSLTDDPAAMVQQTDLSLIIVPTPSLADGKFSHHAVEEVLRVIGPALKKTPSFHVVNVVSTVMPGACQGIFQPLLERLSGKICGVDFGLVYNPEFIALGSVIHNFLNPDLVLVGASDDHSAALVRELYRTTCTNAPHLAIMSLVNAEITKLSLNCFITMKISFANELAAICEQVPGADADVITPALGADTRIGPKCLKSGLGFGGPCFPRDNLAFQVFAREAGWQARLAPQVEQVNRQVVARLHRRIRQEINPPGRISLLGLSYKPGTHVVEESQSVELALKLARDGYAVRVHDPLALDEARYLLGDQAAYCPDPYHCLEKADGVILLTNWPLYAWLDWEAVSFSVKGYPLLVDCWGILKGRAPANFRYVSLGSGPRASAGAGAPRPDFLASGREEGLIGKPTGPEAGS